MSGDNRWRVPVGTTLALLAFAANSLLCRLALSTSLIDPASFSTIRLVSGAATLAVVVRSRKARPEGATPSWASGAMLFLYAAPFSFAYVSLSAGTGALLLFGAVQVTMLLGALRRGDRAATWQWLGLALAFGGLVYLVLPGITAPSPFGAGLMLLAGLAWGVYSLRGRGARDPVGQTATNFAATVPMALALSLAAYRMAYAEAGGVVLAILSGAVTSGLGYVVWYRVLPSLSGLAASVVQLSVPILAALGGVVLLGEQITFRLGLATILVLGGIGLALLVKPKVAVER